MQCTLVKRSVLVTISEPGSEIVPDADIKYTKINLAYKCRLVYVLPLSLKAPDSSVFVLFCFLLTFEEVETV